MDITLSLEPPQLHHEEEYLTMVKETVAVDGAYPFNNVPLARADFAAFIQELTDEANGVNLPRGVPRQQTYFIVKDELLIIGELRFRPDIEPPYERYNGHIGYNIRPAFRGHGHATQALTLALRIARSHGLPGVQLTIHSDNPASVRVIEKNGGTLAKIAPSDDKPDEQIACYWIDTGRE